MRACARLFSFFTSGVYGIKILLGRLGFEGSGCLKTYN